MGPNQASKRPRQPVRQRRANSGGGQECQQTYGQHLQRKAGGGGRAPRQTGCPPPRGSAPRPRPGTASTGPPPPPPLAAAPAAAPPPPLPPLPPLAPQRMSCRRPEGGRGRRWRPAERGTGRGEVGCQGHNPSAASGSGGSSLSLRPGGCKQQQQQTMAAAAAATPPSTTNNGKRWPVAGRATPNFPGDGVV